MFYNYDHSHLFCSSSLSLSIVIQLFALCTILLLHFLGSTAHNWYRKIIRKNVFRNFVFTSYFDASSLFILNFRPSAVFKFPIFFWKVAHNVYHVLTLHVIIIVRSFTFRNNTVRILILIFFCFIKNVFKFATYVN